MALSLNRMTVLGHVGNDPELRHAGNGTPVVNLSIATRKRWLDKQGQKQERTTWHRCVFWDKLAELVVQVVAKGMKVLVEGELVYEQYVDKEGRQREKAYIRASEFVAMGNSSDRQAMGLSPQVKAEPTTVRDEHWPGLPDSEDLPF